MARCPQHIHLDQLPGNAEGEGPHGGGVVGALAEMPVVGVEHRMQDVDPRDEQGRSAFRQASSCAPKFCPFIYQFVFCFPALLLPVVEEWRSVWKGTDM